MLCEVFTISRLPCFLASNATASDLECRATGIPSMPPGHVQLTPRSYNFLGMGPPSRKVLHCFGAIDLSSQRLHSMGGSALLSFAQRVYFFSHLHFMSIGLRNSKAEES